MLNNLEKKFEAIHLIAPISTVITIVSTVIYITWFAASIEKRVSLVEQHSAQIQTTLDQSNAEESLLRIHFQDEVHTQFARLDDKIDKIYGVLVDVKRSI